MTKKKSLGWTIILALSAVSTQAMTGCSDDSSSPRDAAASGGADGGIRADAGADRDSSIGSGGTGTGGGGLGGGGIAGTGGIRGTGGIVGSGGAGAVGGNGGSSSGGAAGGSSVGGSGGAGGTAGRGGAGGGGAGGIAGAGGYAGAGGVGGSNPGGAGGAAGAVATLTDGQILAVVLDANLGEVHTAEVARTRSTNDGVLELASDIAEDHGDAITRLTTLAASAQIVAADSVQRRTVSSAGSTAVETLWGASAAGFDTTFVSIQIGLHTSVLDLLDTTLIPAARNANLKSELQTERTAVQNHLTHARALAAANAPDGGAGGSAP